jgi:hypothetical protein
VVDEPNRGWLSSAARLAPLEPVDAPTDRAQSARMYDYFLGGKTNFPADRATAQLALQAFPGIRDFARENRRFMTRAARQAADRGLRQFLDIGTGIPTSPNLHETVQATAPDARIVYADNDPIVLTHARALLANSTPQGRIDYLHADLRDPAALLGHPALTGPDPALDLTQPVALNLIAVLHFIPDDRDPYAIVRTLLNALPSGSTLALSHATGDVDPANIDRAVTAYRASGVDFQVRTRAEVARFADGLELLDGGVRMLGEDGGGGDGAGEGSDVAGYCLLARKP